jgi:TatD DNase family protein
MAFFDTHCHLQDPRFGNELDPVLARARQAGVTHMVCCGTREGDWSEVLALSRRHAGVLPMLGLHPWFVREARPGWPDRLGALVKNELVGIGECGLDFALENPDRELQEAVCRSQLRLAREHNRPLSIHCRRAWEHLALLAREEGLPEAGAVVHAFSGSAEVALDLQSLGFHLSFACSLANPDNSRGAKAVVAVAEDRLLFETDAPDLPPRKLPGFEAGAPNEPANIHLVAEAAARLRGTDFHSTAALAYKNSERIFGGLRP